MVLTDTMKEAAERRYNQRERNLGYMEPRDLKPVFAEFGKGWVLVGWK